MSRVMPHASAALFGRPALSPPAWERNDLMQRTLAIVLAGGRGSRLDPLTQHRAKPAVEFGGCYRIIDFTLANCVNSGLRRVAVLTQYKAQSLIRHLHENWSLSSRLGEFIEPVPAQQRAGDDWYAGTADAVAQNLDLIERIDPEFVLVLGGDHVYKMDYTKLLAEHARWKAEASVACVEVPIESASEFGVVEVDGQHRIVGWQEKPRTARPLPGSRGTVLASMGIYAFRTAALLKALHDDRQAADSGHDFGHDVIPSLLRAGRHVQAHPFAHSCVGAAGCTPYWRDVGTLDAYWAANVELATGEHECDVFDSEWPVPAYRDCGPPTRFQCGQPRGNGIVSSSWVGGGCSIGSAEIRSSIVFNGASVDDGARLEESLVLPRSRVGAGASLRRVIIDHDCEVPEGLRVGFDAEHDRLRFHVTPQGITLITAEMLEHRQAEPGSDFGSPMARRTEVVK